MTNEHQPATKISDILVAILDDYSNIQDPVSTQHFKPLVADNTIQAFHPYPKTLNTRTPDGLQAAIKRLQPYAVISTMRERTPFPAELICALPNLKVLLTTGGRNASIDLQAARDHGVLVAGTGPKANANMQYGPDTTNEQTWALILGLAKGLAADDTRVKTWDGGEDGGWQDGMNFGLAGKKLGLLGLGRLGVQCAITGKLGFGMEVVAWSENLTQEKADDAAAKRGLEKGSFRVAASRKELFGQADVLSVHYVLSERSKGIVGQKELGWMKKSAVLVNTSRGPLVDEGALVDALTEHRIRGAGLDVFDVEPLPRDSVWRSEKWGKRVVLTPHMGYVEEETMDNWYKQTAENVRKWVNGEDILHLMTTK